MQGQAFTDPPNQPGFDAAEGSTLQNNSSTSLEATQ